MTVDEFVKQPRGPALFDHYHHPSPIPSPIGDFTVELHTEMDAPPSEDMIVQAQGLVDRFRRDAAYLSGRVFEAYLGACNEPAWMADADVPLGLSLEEIGRYLNGRALVIADELASVYMCPDWDPEHGLAFDLTERGWEQAD